MTVPPSVKEVTVRLARAHERRKWDALMFEHHYQRFIQFAGRPNVSTASAPDNQSERCKSSPMGSSSTRQSRYSTVLPGAHQRCRAAT